ncbi:SUMO1 sentrin specific peptidase 8 [Homalodisca vitripennis]|nr:SUMO1 sentrin specific peptidase 8 [Homalodisca vitripennis]
MSPTNCGWTNEDGKLKTTWFVGNQLPKAYEDVVITPDVLEDTLYSVNNAVTEGEGSGTHWSLLFYLRTDNTFYYFDSIKQYNLKPAVEMFNKLSKCVSSEQATFKSVVCPQQNNSLDCGIYMLLFVD